MQIYKDEEKKKNRKRYPEKFNRTRIWFISIVKLGRTALFLETESFTAMNEAETKNDMTYVNPILSKEVEMRQRKKSKHWKNTLSILEVKKAQLKHMQVFLLYYKCEFSYVLFL